MTARLKKTVKSALIILFIGALYAFAIHILGRGIPCLFNLVTGFKCPGCGVTRMCLSLLRLDFAAAFAENQVLFCLIPIMLLVAARLIYLYVKKGTVQDRLTRPLIIMMIAVLLVWGVVRNVI